MLPAAATLPGGGVLRTLDHLDGLWAIEQRTADGSTFRWLCSLRENGTLLAETVVRCTPQEQQRRTRSTNGVSFDRDLLMPQYHTAMVAALGLRRGALCRGDCALLHCIEFAVLYPCQLQWE
jgi:hypothetical protein